MRWLFTRIVPSELEAVLTTGPLALAFVDGAVLDEDVVVLLVELLLPHAASSNAAARVGNTNLTG